MTPTTETLTLLIIATPMFLLVHLLTTYLETGTIPDLRQPLVWLKQPLADQENRERNDEKYADGLVSRQKKSVKRDNTLEIITTGADGVPHVFKKRILHRFHELFDSDSQAAKLARRFFNEVVATRSSTKRDFIQKVDHILSYTLHPKSSDMPRLVHLHAELIRVLIDSEHFVWPTGYFAEETNYDYDPLFEYDGKADAETECSECENDDVSLN